MSRRADAVSFGLDFQVNAAIILMIENMKEMEYIRLESDEEDISIKLNSGKYILAQAKSHIHGSYDFQNVRKDLKKSLTTLSEGANKVVPEKLILVTNSANPLKDDSQTAFIGGGIVGAVVCHHIGSDLVGRKILIGDAFQQMRQYRLLISGCNEDCKATLFHIIGVLRRLLMQNCRDKQISNLISVQNGENHCQCDSDCYHYHCKLMHIITSLFLASSLDAFLSANIKGHQATVDLAIVYISARTLSVDSCLLTDTLYHIYWKFTIELPKFTKDLRIKVSHFATNVIVHFV